MGGLLRRGGQLQLDILREDIIMLDRALFGFGDLDNMDRDAIFDHVTLFVEWCFHKSRASQRNGTEIEK